MHARALVSFALVAIVTTTVAVAGNYLEGIGVPACIAAADRAVAAVISATPAP